MSTRPVSSPPQLSGFTYVRLLGSGGFADVFLFQQAMPNRQVAVKVLLRDMTNQAAKDMFRFEMDAMGRLGPHPSILTVHQAGISSDGRPYLVMEFCPEGLGRAWRKRPLPLADVLNIGVRMAAALETAHRASVLHRDIKPSNILLTEYSNPVLSDFGISSRLSSTDDSDVLAMSVPWSAPEVIREETSGTVASEVWSLGATLYSLLAGRSPFELDDASKNEREKLKSRIVKANYTPIGRSDVPELVERVLLKSMWREPSQRYASMLEFAMELNDLQRTLGLPVTTIDLPTTAWSQFQAAPSAPTPAATDSVSAQAPDALRGGSYVQVESARRRTQN